MYAHSYSSKSNAAARVVAGEDGDFLAFLLDYRLHIVPGCTHAPAIDSPHGPCWNWQGPCAFWHFKFLLAAGKNR